MHFSKILVILTVFLLIFFVPLIINGASDRTDLTEANNLFKDGKFTESEALYAEIVKKDPDNYQTVLSLGRLNLYKNSLGESEKWLKKN